MPKTPIKKKAKPTKKRGFMWKVLKQKQEDQKKLNGVSEFSPHVQQDSRFRINGRQGGFSRFAGPRRRAG